METRRNLEPKTQDALRDLIRINADSYRGFEEAASAVDDRSLAQMFRSIGTDRRNHCHELAKLVSTKDELEGSFKGKMHRWWLDARAKLQGGDAYPVLAEAERGEDEIKQRYETLMRDTVGSAVSDVLHKQFAEVKRNHDRIRDLRDQKKAEKDAS